MNKRSPRTQARYDKAKQDGTTIVEKTEKGTVRFNLDKAEILREYKFWVIIANNFPYDEITDKHDLLIPKRHFAFIREAGDDERHEYYAIKKELDTEGVYDSIIENFSRKRSAPGHFHSHLVVWKES